MAGSGSKNTHPPQADQLLRPPPRRLAGRERPQQPVAALGLRYSGWGAHGSCQEAGGRHHPVGQ